MINVYEFLEKCTLRLQELSAEIMQISRDVNAVLSKHDEYKSSFKVIYGGKFNQNKETVAPMGFSATDKKEEVGAFIENRKEPIIFTLKDGKVRKKGGSYEIRFRKFGYQKSFCATSLEEAQAKFKVFLKDLNKQTQNGKVKPKCKMTVATWATTYLNSYKLYTLCDKAFVNIKRICERYVIARLGDVELKNVKAIQLQELLTSIIADGKSRTAEDVKTFLKGMFEKAYFNDLIKSDPMRGVSIPKHYRKHGTTLTLHEERAFVEAIKGDHYEPVLLFLLYSGARVSEAERLTLSDIDLTANTVAIRTTKLKDRVNAQPRIVPIFPKLRPVLEQAVKSGITFPYKEMANKCGQRFKKYCPSHHLHELRHTFTSRCRENGIDNELTSLWTGHSFAGNTTSAVYTHFSMEFQQKQAVRLDY